MHQTPFASPLDPALPVHPTKRHPLTGDPLQAVYVTSRGRVMWPIIGASPDEPPAGGQGGQGGSGTGGSGNDQGAGQSGGQSGGQGAGQSGSGDQGTGGRSNATDGQGNDLGFPAETPIAEMTDKQQAAYWRHNARKHETTWKSVAGDRPLADVQKDLQELGEIRRSQQTPADQALSERYDQGKNEGIKAARTETATTLFRGALETAGVAAAEIDDLVSNLNVANFVTDSGVDTTKIRDFARKFTPAGRDGNQQRGRDFGGGPRREGQERRGDRGRAEAQKRHPKPSNT